MGCPFVRVALVALVADVAAASPVGVVGVLSATDHLPQRDAIRETWFTFLDAHAIVGRFLVDESSDAIAVENTAHGDVHVLHARATGMAVRFGEKLALWFKHAQKTYPNAQWVAKADDDLYACPAFFAWLARAAHRTVYLGWFHDGRGERTPHSMLWVKERMDEAFVVVGMELVENIAARDYCPDRDTCDATVGLYDTNFRGVSLGIWLTAPAIKKRVKRVAMNSKVLDIRNSPKQREVYASPDDERSVGVASCDCEHWLLYHPIKNATDICAFHARALRRR